MFSSRILTDRNNDPEPLRCDDDHTGLGFCRYTPEYVAQHSRGQWFGFSDPRPAYQYGTLPENPILVRLRVLEAKPGNIITREAFLYSLVGPNAWQWHDTATTAQIAHAVRVISLSLLAAVTQ